MKKKAFSSWPLASGSSETTRTRTTPAWQERERVARLADGSLQRMADAIREMLGLAPLFDRSGDRDLDEVRFHIPTRPDPASKTDPRGLHGS